MLRFSGRKRYDSAARAGHANAVEPEVRWSKTRDSGMISIESSLQKAIDENNVSYILPESFLLAKS